MLSVHFVCCFIVEFLFEILGNMTLMWFMSGKDSLLQGSFWARALPMKDGIVIWRRLSLAGPCPEWSLTQWWDSSKVMHMKHGSPSTQPNWITHNLAAHQRIAHNPAARWCAGSVVCVTCMSNPLHNLTSQTAMQDGLTLAQRRDDSTDVGPTLCQPTLLSEQIAHNRASTPPSRWVVCSSVVCY